MRHNTNRRAMLGGMAAACLIPAAASQSVNPDAELLSAWENYKKWWLVIDALPPETKREDLAPYYVHHNHYGDLVESLPAKTANGLAVKLKYLFKSFSESRWAELAVINGHPCDEAELGNDFREKMLWSLISDVQKMGV